MSVSGIVFSCVVCGGDASSIFDPGVMRSGNGVIHRDPSVCDDRIVDLWYLLESLEPSQKMTDCHLGMAGGKVLR